MKVYVTGMLTHHPDMQVPHRDGTPGKTEDHITVDATRVVKVKELIEWCRANAHKDITDLAQLLLEETQ